jgi:uncharacterized protein
VWRPSDIADALRQPREAFKETRHRPWPLPAGPWVLGQTWQDLLFAHWRVDEAALREHVPPQIPIDTFDGSAWIGVTPFMVTGARPRFMLPIPGVARFPEVNVRTYATIEGRPGIWFFSLDTPSRMAVAAARRVYRVPYFRSRIGMDRDGGRVRYGSERVDASGPKVGIDLEYGPTGPVHNAAPDSWEYWMSERYCLYTLDDEQRVVRGDIHHPPWPLQPAEATFVSNTMGREVGIDLDGEPRLHFAQRQDVVFWLLGKA